MELRWLFPPHVQYGKTSHRGTNGKGGREGGSGEGGGLPAVYRNGI